MQIPVPCRALALAFFWVAVPCAGVRIAEEAELGQAAGSDVSILAVTHNAGNKKGYTDVEAKELMENLVGSDFSDDKDLLLLGMQEFNDKGGKFFEYVKANLVPGGVLGQVVSHKSALWCWFGGRGYTELYIFQRKKPQWTMQLTPFDISQEQTYFFGVRKECAKGVAGAVIKATRGKDSMTICAMNTHLSMSGTTRTRIGSMQGAMDRLKAEKCSSVIYMGDFNSRLHCNPTAKGRTQPLFQEKFTTVLDAFRQRTASESDEMHHLLEDRQVKCFEKDKKGWKEVDTPNGELPEKLMEAGTGHFDPTYKLFAKDELNKAKPPIKPELMACPLNSKTKACMANPKDRPEHNPAWTDRILLGKQTPGFKTTTKTYGRRDIDLGWSDHGVVYANLVVSSGSWW